MTMINDLDAAMKALIRPVLWNYCSSLRYRFVRRRSRAGRRRSGRESAMHGHRQTTAEQKSKVLYSAPLARGISHPDILLATDFLG